VVPTNRDGTTWLAIRLPRHSLAISLVTASSVRLCLSLNEFDCRHAARSEALPQSRTVVYVSKNVCILLKTNLLDLCALWGYVIPALLLSHKFWKPNKRLTLKTGADVSEGFIGPFNMYRQVKHAAILRSAHTVCLCGSQNKQRLFPYTALRDWFL
jgi:hypothetical protein